MASPIAGGSASSLAVFLVFGGLAGVATTLVSLALAAATNRLSFNMKWPTAND